MEICLCPPTAVILQEWFLSVFAQPSIPFLARIQSRGNSVFTTLNLFRKVNLPYTIYLFNKRQHPPPTKEGSWLVWGLKAHLKNITHVLKERGVYSMIGGYSSQGTHKCSLITMRNYIIIHTMSNFCLLLISLFKWLCI